MITGTEFSGVMLMDGKPENSEGTITVGALASLVFGVKTAEEICADGDAVMSERMKEELGKIIPLSRAVSYTHLDVYKRQEVKDVREKWLDMLKDLNVCSQKGLVEMFDGSIGAASVFMPHGGKYQKTETQAMVAKLPVLTGDCDTVSMMSYGFDPYLSTWLSLIHIFQKELI